MKYGIIGFGKMGQELLKILGTKDLDFIVDPNLKITPDGIDIKSILKDLTELDKQNAEIIFEFTNPSSASSNIEFLLTKFKNTNLKIISGSTGWNPFCLKTLVLDSNAQLLYSSNFSVGINLISKIFILLKELKTDYFDFSMLEIHHKNKIDTPSGTASMLKNVLNNDNLKISSIRSGNFPGTHSLFLDALNETIEITHTARNRKVFCDGAILAAKWLLEKKSAGIYTFSDVLDNK